MKTRVEIYEDNGGQLYLAIVENEICTEIIQNWEYNAPGCLYEALAILSVDPLDYKTWGGSLTENGERSIEELPAIYDAGLGKLIAEITPYGAIMIYPAEMGIAGCKAFAIPTDR